MYIWHVICTLSYVSNYIYIHAMCRHCISTHIARAYYRYTYYYIVNYMLHIIYSIFHITYYISHTIYCIYKGTYIYRNIPPGWKLNV